jgi:hypothetical protein
MSFVLTPPPPPQRRRRALWQDELRRADSVWRERSYRTEQRIDAAIARIARRVDDMLQRLTDLERAAGVADLDRAPRRPARRWTG